MARRAFYSFHYKEDSWRAGKIRNIGVIEGNKPASDNDWETIAGGGDKAIKKWINEQMTGRSVVIVLIGEKTAGRKWINYEIKYAYENNKKLLGIHIHNIIDQSAKRSKKGGNPFDVCKYGGKPISQLINVKAYDPPRKTSKGVYSYIEDNLEDWIETAFSNQG